MIESAVKLTKINGKVYCFSAKDYFEIRYNHRVIGNLVGPSAGFPKDLNYSGLPAIFIECEIQFLIDKGFAKIIQKPSLFETPTEEDVESFKKSFNEQQDQLKTAEDEKSMKIFMKNLDNVFRGREKARKNPKRNLPEMSVTDLIEDQKKKLAETPLKTSIIHVPTTNLLLSTTETSSIFESQNKFKCKVFQDLWEKGYTVTSGETFGGDFLAYPGDPLHYHASHIIILQSDSRKNLLELVKHGRASVIVNKKCVFVHQSATGDLVYENMEWVNPLKKRVGT